MVKTKIWFCSNNFELEFSVHTHSTLKNVFASLLSHTEEKLFSFLSLYKWLSEKSN